MHEAEGCYMLSHALIPVASVFGGEHLGNGAGVFIVPSVYELGLSAERKRIA